MSRVLSCFSAVILVAAAGVPQVSTGNIRGTVLDSSGAVIPNAAITITNAATAFTRSLTTNERGDFDAPLMPLGDYHITAEAVGFQKKMVTGVNLQVDQTAVIRIALEPGTLAEAVEVTA